MTTTHVELMYYEITGNKIDHKGLDILRYDGNAATVRPAINNILSALRYMTKPPLPYHWLGAEAEAL